MERKKEKNRSGDLVAVVFLLSGARLRVAQRRPRKQPAPPAAAARSACEPRRDPCFIRARLIESAPGIPGLRASASPRTASAAPARRSSGPRGGAPQQHQ